MGQRFVESFGRRALMTFALALLVFEAMKLIDGRSYNPTMKRQFFPTPEHLRLTGPAQERFHELALAKTASQFGKSVFVRAVVEVSNYCRQNCSYCGMRRENKSLDRYRAEA